MKTASTSCLNVAAIAGTQFLYATRNRQDRFLSNGDQSGATEFRLWSPKAGLLWQVDPTWQVFGNISRSAEVPSFGESSNRAGNTVHSLHQHPAADRHHL